MQQTWQRTPAKVSSFFSFLGRYNRREVVGARKSAENALITSWKKSSACSNSVSSNFSMSIGCSSLPLDLMDTFRHLQVICIFGSIGTDDKQEESIFRRKIENRWDHEQPWTADWRYTNNLNRFFVPFSRIRATQIFLTDHKGRRLSTRYLATNN